MNTRDVEEVISNALHDIDDVRIEKIKVREKTMDGNYLPTDYQSFIHKSTLRRWLDTEGRKRKLGMKLYLSYVSKYM